MSPLEMINKHFASVDDPRQVRKTEYPLINIIFMTICAVLCGAEDWVAIELFCQSQQAWLKQYLKMANGVPSHDTFGRVFAALDNEHFCQGFVNWMRTVAEIVEGEVVAIDGKQLRRSHDRYVGKGAIHMVSAWATANGVVLGQRKVAEKSNEITAIPKLLEVLDLAGCIVTIAAMGCQTEIAAQIIDQEADYVLSLKGNQGQLHEDVEAMFAYFEKADFANIDHDYHQTVEKGHGRLEKRQCWVFEPQPWQAYFRTLADWTGLKSVAMVRGQRQIGDEVTRETRFFITSLAAQAKTILQAVRRHWGIENELHWVLDVAFNEDQSRVRQGQAAENLAVIRQLVLNLLKQDKTVKSGIKNKRLRCGWDTAYRNKVIAGAKILC